MLLIIPKTHKFNVISSSIEKFMRDRFEVKRLASLKRANIRSVGSMRNYTKIHSNNFVNFITRSSTVIVTRVQFNIHAQVQNIKF